LYDLRMSADEMKQQQDKNGTGKLNQASGMEHEHGPRRKYSKAQ